jgi:hypothetical protein
VTADSVAVCSDAFAVSATQEIDSLASAAASALDLAACRAPHRDQRRDSQDDVHHDEESVHGGNHAAAITYSGRDSAGREKSGQRPDIPE